MLNLEPNVKVLLVDDEDDFREAMKFNLNSIYGANVKDVDSGELAISILENEKDFDAIFLDIMLPGINGLETYQTLIGNNITCPIIIMSAYYKSAEWKEAERLQLQIVQKPISQEKLDMIFDELR